MPALDPELIDTPEALSERYAERTRTICNDCGAPANPPKTVIAAFPRPWRNHLDGRVLCADCWSAEAAAETPLTPVRARVLALDSLGFDAAAVARTSGRDSETIRDHRAAIDELRSACGKPLSRLLEAL